MTIDSHKLIFHPERVVEWKEKGDCFPIYVEIGPTNRCNQRCVFCALDYLGHGGHDIQKETMLTNLEDMAKHDIKSVMFAGEGEPLLHKDIWEFIATAKRNGIDVSVTTNGVLLTPEKADLILPRLSWIRFSVDAGTRESYAKIHSTKESDFDVVIANLKYASELKKKEGYKATIGTQLLLISLNQDEIVQAIRLLKENGADNVQIKPYSHHPLSKNDYSFDYKKVIGLKEKLEKLVDENFKVFYREKTMSRLASEIDYDKCYGLPFFALIDSKGNVIPCNLFYNNEEFTYGNLYKNSFSEIWNGERRKKIIKRLDDKGCSECRKGCRLDVINRYLNRIKHPEEHDNFL